MVFSRVHVVFTEKGWVSHVLDVLDVLDEDTA